jgi:hypothetical protein
MATIAGTDGRRVALIGGIGRNGRSNYVSISRVTWPARGQLAIPDENLVSTRTPQVTLRPGTFTEHGRTGPAGGQSLLCSDPQRSSADTDPLQARVGPPP